MLEAANEVLKGSITRKKMLVFVKVAQIKLGSVKKLLVMCTVLKKNNTEILNIY